MPKALKSCPKSKKSPDLVTLLRDKFQNGRTLLLNRSIDHSVTRLGDFYNFLATKNLTKVAQIFWWLFGLFLIMSLICKKYVATFWAIFWWKLGNFLFHYLVTLIDQEPKVIILSRKKLFILPRDNFGHFQPGPDIAKHFFGRKWWSFQLVKLEKYWCITQRIF